MIDSLPFNILRKSRKFKSIPGKIINQFRAGYGFSLFFNS